MFPVQSTTQLKLKVILGVKISNHKSAIERAPRIFLSDWAQAEIDRDEARTIGDNYPRGENTLRDSKKELLFDARAAPSIYSEAPRLTAYKRVQQNE